MPKTIVQPNRSKRVPLSLRITAELRARLEASAAHSGRNMTQEVEWLLETSVNPKANQSGIVGSRETHELLGELSRYITRLERSRGKPWFETAGDLQDDKFDKTIAGVFQQLLQFERVMHEPLSVVEAKRIEAEPEMSFAGLDPSSSDQSKPEDLCIEARGRALDV